MRTDAVIGSSGNPPAPARTETEVCPMNDDVIRPGTPSATGEPRLRPARPLVSAAPGTPRMKSRWIFPPEREGWPDFGLSEWSLTGASWSDHHPHSETNVVLEGELHVESGGTTVVARAGDTVTVPPGAQGRYWAPVYARMLAIYGPNPTGAPTELIGYEEV
ncbi:cupin domain-containing protein [Kineosporia sp. J2-2]|uniref:Cupin domain-containing protein n=1 Tax=Kineosporia corallincola TaxID=2835133 RepID=A0ABS5TK93_9ACTN|nr:cupin domain-containing protein [Kineosporia corallincola]MBT0771501.1 cupin domain-containing protein [Kineosporia corallincola]